MTATVPSESTSPSRRALLAAALGGAAAMVARSVVSPGPVRAAGDDGQFIDIGNTFGNVQSQTTLGNQGNNNIVLWVASNAGSGFGGGTALVGHSDHGRGVQGQTASGGIGVYGSSTSGYGVWGLSDSFIGVHGSSVAYQGVYGYSSSDVGVYGQTGATDRAGVVGQSPNGSTAVLGYSGTGLVPSAKAKTGVYGYAAQDAAGRGVIGETGSGHGVHGIATSGWAGYFAGRVYTTKYHEMKEISAPKAPAPNHGRLFMRDNGAGKTQLCVRFNTGGVLVIKTQP